MKNKNFGKFIVVFLLFFLGGSVLSIILNSIGIDTSTFDAKDLNYFQCLVELLYLVVIYLLYRNYFVNDYKSFKGDLKGKIGLVIKFTVLFFAVKIASALLTQFVGEILGLEITESENQQLITSITSSGPIIMLISTAFLAPFVEEGIFRLGIRKVISNKYVFIVVSGLLFGLMHIFPTELSMSVALTYSIVYVVMGVYLAYVYVETDNIWISIIIHAINNLISMIAIISFM